jgi:polysaccharide export outer membrane protein
MKFQYGLLMFAIFFGCVPVKKMKYLQTENNPNKVPKYQPVKTYNNQNYTYHFKPDDIISIKISSATPSELNFFNIAEEKSIREANRTEPLLSGFKIAADGEIELPVIGSVQLAGLTLEEAEDKIKSLVIDYLEAPSVNIQLLNFDYTVVGEVNEEGKYNNYDTRITILEAIGEAGGFSDYADRKNVKIVRNINDTTTIAYVNLLEDDILESDYYYLRPNDVIAISPLPAKNWRVHMAANIGLIFSGLAAMSLLLLRVN